MGFLQDNFISKFFLLVFNWLGDAFGDYAIAIILFTIVIRLAMLPADIRQKKSSREMARIQPELNKIKQRYANDPQLMQRKQQELQRKEGVKPLAGCLPMLITLPIFFAFFGSLRMLATEQTLAMLLQGLNEGIHSVDLPNWLWINNIWQPDSGLSSILPKGNELLRFFTQNATYVNPQTLSIMQAKGLISYTDAGLVINNAYNDLVNGIVTANGRAGLSNGWFIMPILAGGTLFFQTWLNNKMNPAMSEQQGGQMMMWMMPLFSVYICYISNAAFALYWVVSNLYALVQLLIVNRILDRKQAKINQNVIAR